MIDPELLDKLACPESRQPLRLATDEELGDLRRRLEAGELKRVGGEPAEGPLEGALVREDGAVCYPIRDALPRLLVEEGIALG